ncbi:F-box protein [Thalictrum thalictroides]|uniref:F-box protein n=1 Tax=Thalictrum thalictroides TaxID=46969 RepID=A0A7J6VG10_THATH|nr:F-box protein [Thalictrum thalictroides]
MAEETSLSFVDFPEDVQLCILSFLTPSEIASFSCTSKRFLTLCESDNKLWFSMCDRRWGLNTQIKKWGNGQIQFKLLYRILNRWDNLIGFWRRCGTQGVVFGSSSTPPLIFFEWGKSFITGSRVIPSKLSNYKVIKTPFLWMGISPKGVPVSFLDPDCRFESSSDFVRAATELGVLDSDELVSVSVSFIGNNHMVVEENQTFFSSSSSPGYYSPEGRMSSFSDLRVEDEDVNGIESTSPSGLPDRLRSEIYQYFANRTSPSGDRASRRQRKKERERLGRRKLEPEHFVKIVNSFPTPLRPLQGLWKGICDDMSLDFFLVAYDDTGGIACRRLGDTSEPFSGYSPVFWTSNTTFVESPFSPDEEYIYDSRTHLRPPGAMNHNLESPYMENEVVLRFLNINSSYDLVIPGSSVNPRHVEGRIWLLLVSGRAEAVAQEVLPLPWDLFYAYPLNREGNNYYPGFFHGLAPFPVIFNLKHNMRAYQSDYGSDSELH